MSPSEALSLFDYDQWATTKQLEVIRTLSKEQYERDLGSSYGGIGGTLVHIYGAQQTWYTRWIGDTPTGIAGIADVPTFALLEDKWSTLRRGLQEFASSLTEEKLLAPLAYKDLKGNPVRQPMGNLIRHVINHSTYHRGQLTTMFRQVGVTPPGSIDLITYYRERAL